MRGIIIEDAVRLRSGPGTEFEIVVELDAGTVVESTSEHAWREVVTGDGRRGWVAVDYLRRAP